MGNGAAAEGVGILNSVSHAGVSNVRKLLFINSSLYSGLKTNAENEQNAHKKKRNTHATTHFRKLHKWTLLYPPALIKVILYYMDYIRNYSKITLICKLSSSLKVAGFLRRDKEMSVARYNVLAHSKIARVGLWASLLVSVGLGLALVKYQLK